MSECQTSGAEGGWRETFFVLSCNLNTDPPCATYYGLFRKYYTKKSVEEINNNLDY